MPDLNYPVGSPPTGGQTVLPTQVFQPVRAVGYGGNVRQYHVDLTGRVVRFTKAGNPVIRLDAARPVDPAYTGPYRYVVGGNLTPTNTVTDTYGCFRVIDGDGRLVIEPVDFTPEDEA